MKKAFTLIELLVVIAIIAILAAILFPVFAQAKLQAKLTVNLSNLKNLGLATIMYTNDADDSFPLEQTINLNDAAFFGIDPWQVTTQPYIKNWGIFQHPLGPQIPTGNAAITAWRQALMYGAMAKAENSIAGSPNHFTANSGVGSFARRVCNSLPCQYEGLFGSGCSDGNAADNCFYGGSTVVSSYTTTGVGNPASTLMVTEGNMWDLWTGIGLDNICTYGVYWSPGQYDILGTTGQFGMACPAARKIPRAQSAPTGAVGTCTPSNICDGVINFGIQNGFTTFVAADGHATAQDYRGGVEKNIVLPGGTVVLQGMWPQGY
jgi:prepilin-type N-terminal cleavage/methylation domain-containing protein